MSQENQQQPFIDEEEKLPNNIGEDDNQSAFYKVVNIDPSCQEQNNPDESNPVFDSSKLCHSDKIQSPYQQDTVNLQVENEKFAQNINQNSTKDQEDQKTIQINNMKKQFCLLIISATFQRLFTSYMFTSLLNIHRADFDWEYLLSIGIKFFLLFSFIGVMPYLIRKYMPQVKHFFFYLTLTSLVVVFLPMYEFYFKNLHWEGQQRLIASKILDLAEDMSYCSIILFVNGYLINLLNISRGKDLGWYIIYFLTFFQSVRVILQIARYLNIQYGEVALQSYTLIVTICTCIGLVIAYFVLPFKLTITTEQLSDRRVIVNSTIQQDSEIINQQQSTNSNAIKKTRLPRLFSILKERSFWPVIAAPFSQSMLIGFLYDISNKSIENYAQYLQKNVAVYNFIYEISVFLIIIPAGILTEKIMELQNQSLKHRQLKEQNMHKKSSLQELQNNSSIQPADQGSTYIKNNMQTQKNKLIAAINIDFIFTACLVLQLAITTCLININTVAREQNADNISVVVFVQYYILSFVSGLNTGVLWVVSLQIGIRRCCGEIEIFSWALTGLYFSQMIVELLKLKDSIWIYYTMQTIILLFYQLFANTSGYKKFQLMDINGQTAFQEEINKDQFQTRYKLIKQLVKPSRDGLVVTLYKDRYRRCEVVVKSMFTNNAQLADHARDELKTLTSLQCYPHIIQLQQFVCVTEQPNAHQIIMIMQRATNTLDEQIKLCNKKHFPVEVVQKNLKGIICTLGKIQVQKKIAHRDIKPSNIFVVQDEWLLGDFGEAYWHYEQLKAAQKEQKNLQKKGIDDEVEVIQDYITCCIEELTVGTPCYMSPQLYKNYKAIGSEQQQQPPYPNISFYKSDMFSLGLTFLEAVTLEDCSGLNKDKNQKKLTMRLEDSKNIYDGVFYNILKKMLEWDEVKRPHFEELMNLIDQYLNF